MDSTSIHCKTSEDCYQVMVNIELDAGADLSWRNQLRSCPHSSEWKMCWSWFEFIIRTKTGGKLRPACQVARRNARERRRVQTVNAVRHRFNNTQLQRYLFNYVGIFAIARHGPGWIRLRSFGLCQWRQQVETRQQSDHAEANHRLHQTSAVGAASTDDQWNPPTRLIKSHLYSSCHPTVNTNRSICTIS